MKKKSQIRWGLINNTLALLLIFCFGNISGQSWSKKLTLSERDESVGIIQEATSGELISVNNTFYHNDSDRYRIVVTRLPANGGETNPPGVSNTIIWKKQYHFAAYQKAKSFIIDRSGNIIIVGSCVTAGNNVGFVLKLSGNDGSILYCRKTDPGFAGCRLLRVIQMNYGRSNDYLVLGAIGGVYTEKHFLARLDATDLSKIWANNYDVKLGGDYYNELIYSLVQVVGTGNILLGGSVNKDNGYKHIVITLDQSGNVLYHRRFDDDLGRNQTFDNAVATPIDGGYQNFVALLVGRNLGYSQQHGIVIYDAYNQAIVRHTDCVLKSEINANMVTRGGTIKYNSDREELLIGLNLAPSINKWSDWAIQTVKFDDLSLKRTLRFGNVNRDLYNIYSLSSGYYSANYLASDTDVIIGSDLKEKGSVISEVLIGKLSLSNNPTCYDEMDSRLVNVNYNAPDSPFTISKTSADIYTLSCYRSDFGITISNYCESGCTISDCDNDGFEDGDYAPEWTAYVGNACSDSTFGDNFCHSFYKVDYSDPSIDATFSRNPDYNLNIAGRLLVQTTGDDPIIGSLLPVVCPDGGTYSIRLENLTASREKKEATKLVKTMEVPEDNPGMFIYKYALVMEDPVGEHKYFEKPFFRVKVTTVNADCEMTGEMECAKNIVFVDSIRPDEKFINDSGTNFYYKNWTSVGIPLKDFAGQKVKIEFLVSDCAQGGHLGYAYLDGACIDDQPTYSVCSDPEGERDLEAPIGFQSYWWSGPGIMDDNASKKIRVNEAGGYKFIGITESSCSLEYDIDFAACDKPLEDSCIIDSFTAIAGDCNDTSNYFTLTGTVTFTTPPVSGVLIINNGYLSVLYYAPFTSPLNYTVKNLISDGKDHTLTAKFYKSYFVSSKYLACHKSTSYSAPESCATAEIGCENCLTSFNPEPGKYIISAWVKELATDPDIETYSNPFIEIQFTGTGGTLSKMYASGKIIDQWQRLFYEFTIPIGATNISINLGTDGGSALFDDIRIHPANGSFVSYVYDPVSLKLVATLDDNNYATIYEYDNEGTLLRVKKETERGIMTIKESRENSPKR